MRTYPSARATSRNCRSSPCYYPSMETHPNHVLRDVLEVIKESAQERGWSIDVVRPSDNNPERVYVAHVREQDGSAIGMGMSSSSAIAICEAWRSAYQSRIP